MVIMYANTITSSMQRAIDETQRRRKLQEQFNEDHGIVPKTIIKDVRKAIETVEYVTDDELNEYDSDDIQTMIENLTDEMIAAASELEFEKAAQLRDQITKLKQMLKEE